ncbi:MAG TPA: hypothetical protein VK512_26380 [Xanthobacteraceae bacterium]|jgi:hypothetical protein|nr:hypothetical protein [Xanthobacteraceae bacterium]
MKEKTKIWLGVGAFVLAGTGATGAVSPLATETVSGESGLSAQSPDTAMLPATSPGVVIAQHAGHDAGEGGESQGLANLPPDLAFAARVTLLRGHLLVGDELVRQQQWNAALPHFLHPTEEIYGDIRDQLAGYRVPPFDGSLKALSDVVKAKKGGAEYTKALKAVHDALGAADAGMKAKQSDWPGFVVEAAVEALKAATGEYQQAVVGGKIAKPVEYQDARGFILQADRMIESVAPDLQRKDSAALDQVRAGLAELKKAFPSPMPPRTPVKDYGGVLADVSRIELAAGKLM